MRSVIAVADGTLLDPWVRRYDLPHLSKEKLSVELATYDHLHISSHFQLLACRKRLLVSSGWCSGPTLDSYGNIATDNLCHSRKLSVLQAAIWCAGTIPFVLIFATR